MTGSAAMGAPAKPIAADLGGPLFADGAGASVVLATLPLTADFSALFRNFDLMKQKETLKKVSVAG